MGKIAEFFHRLPSVVYYVVSYKFNLGADRIVADLLC